jgi:hypothetical protein
VHFLKRSRLTQRALVKGGASGLAGLALLAGTAACGDQPTANRDFFAVATHSSYVDFFRMPPGTTFSPVQHQVLSGYLVGSDGKPLAGTLFHEDCATLAPQGSALGDPTVCTTTLKTGTNTYVARGSASAQTGGVHGPYFGQLGSLGPGGSFGPGSAVMWMLPDGTGTTPIHMKISIRLWGSAPVVS